MKTVESFSFSLIEGVCLCMAQADMSPGLLEKLKGLGLHYARDLIVANITEPGRVQYYLFLTSTVDQSWLLNALMRIEPWGLAGDMYLSPVPSIMTTAQICDLLEEGRIEVTYQSKDDPGGASK